MKDEAADSGFWSRRVALSGLPARGVRAGLMILAMLPGLVAASAENQGAAMPGQRQSLILERLFHIEISPAGRGDVEKDPHRPAQELTCLYRSLLPANQGPSVWRLLCLEGDAPWMVVYNRLDPADQFPLQGLVVDVADGAWIRFRAEFPKAAHIEDQESTEEWIARLSSGEFGRPMVRVDTDMLRFDPIGEDEELEPFARKVARDIQDRQPELAAFLSWTVTWLNTDEGRHLSFASGLLHDLSTFAGFAPEKTSRFRVEIEKLHAHVSEKEPRESLDPDLESAFGKWVSWPDFPRLDD